MGAVLVEAAVGALGVELSEGGSDVVAVAAEGGAGGVVLAVEGLGEA